MKWTKFSSGEYPKVGDRATIFITDYHGIWCDNANRSDFKAYMKNNPDYAWAEIEFPEVPKKELHRCIQEHAFVAVCEEDEKGRLFLSLNEMDTKKSMVIVVRLCPFCGYSVKEKHKTESTAEWGTNWPATRPKEKE